MLQQNSHRNHQLYRFEGKEVVLDREADFHLNSSGKPERIKSWWVYSVYLSGSDPVLGPRLQAPADKLQWVGRTVRLQDSPAAG